LQCSTSGGGGPGVCKKTCGGSYPNTGYAGNTGLDDKCGTGLDDDNAPGGTTLTCGCRVGFKCSTPPGMQTPGTVYNCVCDPDPNPVCPPNYTGPLIDNCGTFIRNCTG